MFKNAPYIYMCTVRVYTTVIDLSDCKVYDLGSSHKKRTQWESFAGNGVKRLETWYSTMIGCIEMIALPLKVLSVWTGSVLINSLKVTRIQVISITDLMTAIMWVLCFKTYLSKSIFLIGRISMKLIFW